MKTAMHYSPSTNVAALVADQGHGACSVEMFTVPAYFNDMGFFNVCGVEMVELRSTLRSDSN